MSHRICTERDIAFNPQAGCHEQVAAGGNEADKRRGATRLLATALAGALCLIAPLWAQAADDTQAPADTQLSSTATGAADTKADDKTDQSKDKDKKKDDDKNTPQLSTEGTLPLSSPYAFNSPTDFHPPMRRPVPLGIGWTGGPPVSYLLAPGDPRTPPPPETPTPGLIVGTGGLIGGVGGTINPVVSALLDPTDPYYHSGALKLSKANVTMAYGGGVQISVGGINLVTVPVSVLNTLSAVDGTLVGTGQNQHLTLLGGVTSDSYITNINNGATNGGTISSDDPAWSKNCVDVDIAGVLGVDVPCWGVNAAQNSQVIIGDGAYADGSEEVVIGTGARHDLSDVNANVVFPGDGNRNSATDPMGLPNADYDSRLGHSVVIGDKATGTANAQTILGAEATSNQPNSVALGYGSNAGRGPSAVWGTQPNGEYNAYGLTASQKSAGEVAVGNTGHNRQITHVAAGSDDYDAVNVKQLKGAISGVSGTATHFYGVNSSDTTDSNYNGGGAVGSDALAAGVSAAASGDDSLAVGSDATAHDEQSIAIGAGAESGTAAGSGGGSIAIGGQATNAGVPTGPAAKATGYDSIAIGSGAFADATSGLQAAIAIGKSAEATGPNAFALGSNAQAGNAGMAFGAGAGATNGGVAIGNAANTGPMLVPGLVPNNNVAIGTAAQVTAGGFNVALGANSVAGGADLSSANPGYDPSDPAGQTHIVGTTPLGEVSVGDPSASTGKQYRRITNVAAGADATDAVNVSQLKSLETAMQAGQTHYYSVNSTVTGVGSNYANDGATGADALAAGVGASTAAQDSIAIGHNAVVTNTGKNGIALGVNATVNRSDAIALGNGANGNGVQSVVIGAAAGNLMQQSDQSVLIGANAGGSMKAGDRNTGVGFNALNGVTTSAGGSSGGNTALGDRAGSHATGDANTSVGGAAGMNVTGSNNVMVGDNAGFGMIGSNNTVLGSQANITGLSNSVALGAGSQATALHNKGPFTIDGSTAAGAGFTAVVSVGNDNKERQIQNVAPGELTAASTDAINGSQLYATNQVVNGLDDIAVKYDDDGTGNPDYTNVTLGDGTSIYDPTTNSGGGTQIHNVAEGTAAGDAVNLHQLTEVKTLAGKGWNLTVGGANGTEVNPGETVDFSSADNNIVLGKSTTSNDVTFGLANKIVIGSSSSITVNGTTGHITGLTNTTWDPNNFTSGQAATEDQLAKVSGNISGAGLNFMGDDGTSVHRDLGDTLSITGGATGTLASAGNIGVSAVDTDGDGIEDSLELKLAEDVKLGSTGSLTIGNSVLDDSGLVIGTGATQVSLTSTGLNNGGNKIVNVGAGIIGASSTEAINGSQLYALGNSMVTVLGGTANYDTSTGEISMTNIGGTGYDTIDEAIGAANTAATAGWNVADDSGNTNNIGPGGKVTFNSDGNNIKVTESGTDDDAKVEIALNEDIDLGTTGSVKTGATTMDNSGVEVDDGTNKTTVAAGSVTVSDSDSATDDVVLSSTGLDNGGNQIHGVAKGTANTDAVNVAQLDDAISNVGKNLDPLTFAGDSGTDVDRKLGDTINVTGGETDSTKLVYKNNIGVVANGSDTLEIRLAKDINLGSDGSVTMGDTIVNNNGMTVDDGAGNKTVITTGGMTVSNDQGNSATYDAMGLTIAGGPSITNVGINAGGDRITNVAPGINNSDAATVGQVKAVKGWSKNYTDQKFNSIKDDIGELSDRMEAGVASALAVASLPQAYAPGQSIATIAVGQYEGQTGFAVGVSTITDSGQYIFDLNMNTNTQGDLGVAVGMGIVF